MFFFFFFLLVDQHSSLQHIIITYLDSMLTGIIRKQDICGFLHVDKTITFFESYSTLNCA